jgi:SAM-dependent methyltransferase
VSKINKIIELGPKNFFICLVKKLYYSQLRNKFKFHPWHSSAPFECRSYKQIIVDIANDLNVNVVVEVGCGLGEIVSRVKSNKRYGIDVEKEVISAANHLYSHKVKFLVGSFEKILEIEDSKVDLLICVNWIHGLEPQSLTNSIMNLIDKNKVHYLLFDRIRKEQANYKFKHDFEAYFGNVTKKISSFQSGKEGVRTLELFEVLS